MPRIISIVVLLIAPGDFWDSDSVPLIGSIPHSPVGSSVIVAERMSQRKSNEHSMSLYTCVCTCMYMYVV